MPLRTGERAAGLRLRASDLDCEWGQGQEMTDTGEALLMAVTGRRIFASPAVRSRRGHPVRRGGWQASMYRYASPRPKNALICRRQGLPGLPRRWHPRPWYTLYVARRRWR
jgi:hypothetical protein